MTRAPKRVGATGNTLWSPGASLDAAMLAYTIGDDPVWDARLLRWDILGSLGHAAGLRRSGIISAREYVRMQRALRAALRAAETGKLAIEPGQEDVHSAVEIWLTGRYGAVGERLHTGRSRNDQVAADLRLYLKDEGLRLHGAALDLADALLEFAGRHARVLWPGYTHQRRGMPSSAGVWAAGYAEGVLDTAESLAGVWPRLDRSPLGSAAGYGAPLPLDREATARALGFAGVDHAVTTVQGSRGKVEAAVLFWCVQFGHDLGRLSTDVILFTAEEFGWLTLPAELATGSSIMPQKRNPDLFELTRARAGVVQGELAAVLAISGKLSGGYHRDFQLLKAPLMRGIDATGAMLTMMAAAVPRLGVDPARGRRALDGPTLATDEVMRRVREGTPFRRAYREVAAAVRAGEPMPDLASAEILESRRSTGGLGNLGLQALRARLRSARAWNLRERRRFDRAMAALAGRRSQ
ncbi:MAG TPA: argininosuccinate lyase [Gemmatimonadales bacterium]|nr:argininosuccinate lyase [Gemmatimonadales bacterium]